MKWKIFEVTEEYEANEERMKGQKVKIKWKWNEKAKCQG